MRLVPAPEGQSILCPHCGKGLDEVWKRRIHKGFWRVSDRWLYACGRCRKALGVSSENYF
ncbi:MAG TPA: hypothetical protein VI796_07075 [Candidatus Thermoplasmatota archaeon]|nr:hypothetical protein [Candidatus Thermoplasmatota archaeon]